MTALGIGLAMAYGLFAVAAVCGLIVLRLLWPLLRLAQHRRRLIWVVVLVGVGSTCLVIGQKLFGDVVCHVASHHPR